MTKEARKQNAGGGAMRFRTAGFVGMFLILVAAALLVWGSNNFAALPVDDLLERAYTYLAIGAFRGEARWTAEAAELFERAAAGDPSSAEAHLMAAMSLQALGRIQEAIAYYETVRDLAPSFPVDAMIGDAYFAAGDLEDAEAAYLRALEVEPESVLALSGLARLTERTGRLTDSEMYLRRIIRITAPEPGAYLELAAFFLRHGAPDSALAVLEEVDEERRTGAAYHGQLGFVYEALDRRDEACSELRTALRLGSNDADVTAAIERLGCTPRL